MIWKLVGFNINTFWINSPQLSVQHVIALTWCHGEVNVHTTDVVQQLGFRRKKNHMQMVKWVWVSRGYTVTKGGGQIWDKYFNSASYHWPEGLELLPAASGCLSSWLWLWSRSPHITKHVLRGMFRYLQFTEDTLINNHIHHICLNTHSESRRNVCQCLSNVFPIRRRLSNLTHVNVCKTQVCFLGFSVFMCVLLLWSLIFKKYKYSYLAVLVIQGLKSWSYYSQFHALSWFRDLCSKSSLLSLTSFPNFLVISLLLIKDTPTYAPLILHSLNLSAAAGYEMILCVWVGSYQLALCMPATELYAPQADVLWYVC